MLDMVLVFLNLLRLTLWQLLVLGTETHQQSSGTRGRSDHRTTALSSHAGEAMLKILQARLQQYVNRELQAGFRKGRGTRDQIANIAGSWKKQESSRKTSISALLTMLKPLTVWITINCGEFGKRWEYQTTWPASWETYTQVRKQQLELDMEQQTGSKSGKGVHQACILSPCLFNLYAEYIMRNAGLEEA